MGKSKGGGEQSLPPIMDLLTFTCACCGGNEAITAVNVEDARRQIEDEGHIITDKHYFCNGGCKRQWEDDIERTVTSVLKQVEWNGRSVQTRAPMCPVCKWFKVEGHKDGCKLKRAMEMLSDS